MQVVVALKAAMTPGHEVGKQPQPPRPGEQTHWAFSPQRLSGAHGSHSGMMQTNVSSCGVSVGWFTSDEQMTACGKLQSADVTQ